MQTWEAFSTVLPSSVLTFVSEDCVFPQRTLGEGGGVVGGGDMGGGFKRTMS